MRSCCLWYLRAVSLAAPSFSWPSILFYSILLPICSTPAPISPQRSIDKNSLVLPTVIRTELVITQIHMNKISDVRRMKFSWPWTSHAWIWMEITIGLMTKLPSWLQSIWVQVLKEDVWTWQKSTRILSAYSKNMQDLVFSFVILTIQSKSLIHSQVFGLKVSLQISPVMIVSLQLIPVQQSAMCLSSSLFGSASVVWSILAAFQSV